MTDDFCCLEDVLVDWLDSVPFIWVGDPQSILINGQGMFNSSVGSNAVFQVTGGETVLLRLVNAGLLSYLNVEITGHTMTVIEADGQPIEPLTVSNLDVNIAERYNVLVRMDQPVANYNITVSTKYRSLRVGTALLSYDGAEDIAEPVEVESALEPEILDPAAIMGISELPGDMADFDAELTINGTQVRRMEPLPICTAFAN